MVIRIDANSWEDRELIDNLKVFYKGKQLPGVVAMELHDNAIRLILNEVMNNDCS